MSKFSNTVQFTGFFYFVPNILSGIVHIYFGKIKIKLHALSKKKFLDLNKTC